MAGKRFHVDAIFRAVDRISRPLNRMQGRLGRFSRSAKTAMRGVNRVTDKVAKGLTVGLKKAFQVATVAAVAFGAAAKKVIDTGMEFENTLVRAAVKFPTKIRPGTKAYEELEKAARKTGETTEFSGQQSAEALKFLGAAGFSAQQAIAALPGVVDLATNAETDLQEATTMAADTLGMFGLKVDDQEELMANMARVNDIYVNAANRGNISTQEFYEALSKGGRKAKDASQEIETVAALLDVMGDNGIKGSLAGTQLKRMFSALTAPVGGARRLIKKYIGDLDDGSGNMIGMTDVIARLEKSLDGLGDLKRSKVLKGIFGEIPVVGVSALLGRGSKALKELEQQFYDARGASKENADVIRGTVKGSVDSLKSAIEGVIISIFKLEDKGIKEVVDGMVAWVRANKELITSKIGEFLLMIRDNFDNIVSAIKGIGIAIGIIYGIIGAIKVFNAVMAVSRVIAMTNPVVLIVMAIIAAVALAAYLIIKYWDDIVAYWDYVVDNWRYLFMIFEQIGTDIGNFFADLVESIGEVWESLVDTVGQVIDAIANFFVGVGAAIVSVFMSAVNGAVSVWSGIVGFFSGIWKAITKAVGGEIDAIVGRFERMKTGLIGIWDSIASAIKTAVGKIKTYLGPVYEAVEKGMSIIADTFGGETPAAAMAGAGGGEAPGAAPGREPAGAERTFQPSVVSPQERTERYFSESSSSITNRSELTIKDESGRAELTSGELSPGIKLQRTGTF